MQLKVTFLKAGTLIFGLSMFKYPFAQLFNVMTAVHTPAASPGTTTAATAPKTTCRGPSVKFKYWKRLSQRCALNRISTFILAPPRQQRRV